MRSSYEKMANHKGQHSWPVKQHSLPSSSLGGLPVIFPASVMLSATDQRLGVDSWLEIGPDLRLGLDLWLQNGPDLRLGLDSWLEAGPDLRLGLDLWLQNGPDLRLVLCLWLDYLHHRQVQQGL